MGKPIETGPWPSNFWEYYAAIRRTTDMDFVKGYRRTYPGNVVKNDIDYMSGRMAPPKPPPMLVKAFSRIEYAHSFIERGEMRVSRRSAFGNKEGAVRRMGDWKNDDPREDPNELLNSKWYDKGDEEAAYVCEYSFEHTPIYCMAKTIDGAALFGKYLVIITDTEEFVRRCRTVFSAYGEVRYIGRKVNSPLIIVNEGIRYINTFSHEIVDDVFIKDPKFRGQDEFRFSCTDWRFDSDDESWNVYIGRISDIAY